MNILRALAREEKKSLKLIAETERRVAKIPKAMKVLTKAGTATVTVTLAGTNANNAKLNGQYAFLFSGFNLVQHSARSPGTAQWYRLQ